MVPGNDGFVDAASAAVALRNVSALCAALSTSTGARRRPNEAARHRRGAHTQNTPSTRRTHIHTSSASGLPHDGTTWDMASLAATRLTANAEALAAFYETREVCGARAPAATSSGPSGDTTRSRAGPRKLNTRGSTARCGASRRAVTTRPLMT